MPTACFGYCFLNMSTDGGQCCTRCTPLRLCAGTAKVFGCTGLRKVVASAWGDCLLIKKYASSSDKCSRRISVGERLESMGNCSSLVSISLKRRIKSMGIEEVVTAPRSPWQNPFVERIIGSIRRDCLDHIIVLNERHLRRILRQYFSYYHTCRTHISLNKDPPETRTVEPPELGNIVAFPHVGGLHHRYGSMMENVKND